MRYDEVCLVEVSAQFVEKGDKVHIDLIDELLWKSPPEYEKLPTPAKGQLSFIDLEVIENLIIFTSDNIGFGFQNIGQGTDEGHSSALSGTIDQIGLDEVFTDWLDILEKDTLNILTKINRNRLRNSGVAVSNFIRFITAWEFLPSPWKDEKWNYLGVVDLNKIPDILVEDISDETA